MKNLKSILLAAVCSVASLAYAQVKEVASIGKAIPKESAAAWTQQFAKSNPSAIQGHYYGAQMLRELLSTDGLAGVFIFNGQDQSGKIHLVFKAADKNGDVIESGNAYDDGLLCPPVCQPFTFKNVASIGSKIDEEVASALIGNFQNNNAGKVFSHLYGKTVFETILGQVAVEGMYFSNGLDEKGIEHMILAGVNKNGEVVGSWYNDGTPCPPSCPHGTQTKSVTARKN